MECSPGRPGGALPAPRPRAGRPGVRPALRPGPPPPALAAWVDEAIAEAYAIGAEVERDVMLFVLATIALGPGFARDPSLPWVQAIGRPPRAGAGKVALLRADRLPQHLKEAEGA